MKPLKILVVDDFEMMRFSLSKALKEKGFSDIQEAENGKLAIDKLADADSAGEPYQLIFCDWNMPESNGIDVLSYCRIMPTYQKTPFIMVTAESESQNVILAIKSGASDYIVKPVAPDALAQKLEKIFAKHNLKAA